MITEYKLVCQKCSKEFRARRHDAKYCGAACRMAAFRAAQAEESRRAQEAKELLGAFTRAAAAGDPAVLSDLARRARELGVR
jgi:hypothetical protein